MAAFTRLKRFSEIGAVAAKYGLTPFLPSSLLHVFKLEYKGDDDKTYKNMLLEEKLRHAFEELGTTFIKMGQILSLRSDIIPVSMAEEFKKLTDNVKPIPFSSIKPIIEEELSAPIEEIFLSFNEEPIAAASISQVYSAILKETGSEVVIKVRKPGIVEKIKGDMEIIIWIADILQKTSSYSKSINFKDIAEDFFWTMNQELDLIIEKANTNKFRKNFKGELWSWLAFPEMYEKFCTGKVLVMEKMEGIKLPELVENNNSELFDRKIIADRGAKMLLKMILSDGFFHADIHSGNIFFSENSKISLIDCGMCGIVDRYLKDKIADMFIAFVAKDFEKVANIYIDMSDSSAPENKNEFVREIRKVFEALPDNLSEINTSEIVQKSFGIMFKHKLKIPRNITLLLKTFSMVEGLCRELDPDFQLMTAAEKLSKEIFAERYSPEKLAGDFFILLLKVLDILKTLPSSLSNIAEKIENGTIQHRFLILFGKSERKFISRMVTRVCSAFMVTGSLIASGVLTEKPENLVVYVVFIISSLVFVLTFRKGNGNDN